MNKKSNSKKITKQVLALAFTLILLIAGSYAWLTLQVTGNKTNILRAGTLKLTLDDTTSNGILLKKAVPMSDEKGKTTTEYTFTLQNTGTAVGYTIYLDDVALTDGETQLEDSKVKYQLTKNGKETVALLSSLDNKVIDTGTIEKNKTNTYSLRVWIDSSAENEVMGKILSKELRVEAAQAKQTTPTVTLKIGDYIKMTPTSTSYTVPSSTTGYDSDQTINPSELNLWRVINVNDDGTTDLISESVSSTSVYFKGKTGYRNSISVLNKIAEQYTNSKYTVGSRYTGYSNQTETIADNIVLNSTTPPQNLGYTDTEPRGLGDTGYEKDYSLVMNALGTLSANKVGTSDTATYWLASRHLDCYSSTNWAFMERFINNDGTSSYYSLYYYNNSFNTNSMDNELRPIITLKSGLDPSGSGTSSDPYVLS